MRNDDPTLGSVALDPFQLDLDAAGAPVASQAGLSVAVSEEDAVRRGLSGDGIGDGGASSASGGGGSGSGTQPSTVPHDARIGSAPNNDMRGASRSMGASGKPPLIKRPSTASRVTAAASAAIHNTATLPVHFVLTARLHNAKAEVMPVESIVIGYEIAKLTGAVDRRSSASMDAVVYLSPSIVSFHKPGGRSPSSAASSRMGARKSSNNPSTAVTFSQSLPQAWIVGGLSTASGSGSRLAPSPRDASASKEKGQQPPPRRRSILESPVFGDDHPDALHTAESDRSASAAQNVIDARIRIVVDHISHSVTPSVMHHFLALQASLASEINLFLGAAAKLAEQYRMQRKKRRLKMSLQRGSSSDLLGEREAREHGRPVAAGSLDDDLEEAPPVSASGPGASGGAPGAQEALTFRYSVQLLMHGLTLRALTRSSNTYPPRGAWAEMNTGAFQLALRSNHEVDGSAVHPEETAAWLGSVKFTGVSFALCRRIKGLGVTNLVRMGTNMEIFNKPAADADRSTLTQTISVRVNDSGIMMREGGMEAGIGLWERYARAFELYRLRRAREATVPEYVAENPLHEMDVQLQRVLDGVDVKRSLSETSVLKGLAVQIVLSSVSLCVPYVMPRTPGHCGAAVLTVGTVEVLGNFGKTLRGRGLYEQSTLVGCVVVTEVAASLEDNADLFLQMPVVRQLDGSQERSICIPAASGSVNYCGPLTVRTSGVPGSRARDSPSMRASRSGSKSPFASLRHSRKRVGGPDLDDSRGRPRSSSSGEALGGDSPRHPSRKGSGDLTRELDRPAKVCIVGNVGGPVIKADDAVVLHAVGLRDTFAGVLDFNSTDAAKVLLIDTQVAPPKTIPVTAGLDTTAEPEDPASSAPMAEGDGDPSPYQQYRENVDYMDDDADDSDGISLDELADVRSLGVPERASRAFRVLGVPQVAASTGEVRPIEVDFTAYLETGTMFCYSEAASGESAPPLVRSTTGGGARARPTSSSIAALNPRLPQLHSRQLSRNNNNVIDGFVGGGIAALAARAAMEANAIEHGEADDEGDDASDRVGMVVVFELALPRVAVTASGCQMGPLAAAGTGSGGSSSNNNSSSSNHNKKKKQAAQAAAAGAGLHGDQKLMAQVEIECTPVDVLPMSLVYLQRLVAEFASLNREVAESQRRAHIGAQQFAPEYADHGGMYGDRVPPSGGFGGGAEDGFFSDEEEVSHGWPEDYEHAPDLAPEGPVPHLSRTMVVAMKVMGLAVNVRAVPFGEVGVKFSLPQALDLSVSAGSVEWDPKQALKVVSLSLPELRVAALSTPFASFVVHGVRLAFNEAQGVLEGSKRFHTALVVVDSVETSLNLWRVEKFFAWKSAFDWAMDSAERRLPSKAPEKGASGNTADGVGVDSSQGIPLRGQWRCRWRAV